MRVPDILSPSVAGDDQACSSERIFHRASLLDPAYLCAELLEAGPGWLGKKMRYYRRPLRDLTETLAGSAFVIERINEPTTSEALNTEGPKGL